MLKQTHVLLIDDDDALLRLFGGYLNRAGFEILYGHDGYEGRELARKLLPDIILLDLNLPVMDGYQVCARLKKEEVTRDIPLIILSSSDISKEAEILFRQIGIDDYIHKSVHSDELVKRVKAVLKKRDEAVSSSP